MRIPTIKSFTVATLIALFYLISAPLNSYSLDTKSQWDAAFQLSFGNSDPMLDRTDANEKGKFAWHGHYWVRAYVSMATTYGDAKYLDKAVKLIDHMFFYRDDARQARGEIDIQNDPYVTAPAYYINHRSEAAPAWRIWDTSKDGWRLLVNNQGMITHAIMRFVDLVYNDTRFTAYRQKATEYMAKVEQTVKAYDETFVFNRTNDVPGSYYYPGLTGGLFSGGVEYNMSAAMGATLLLLDKVKGGMPAYRQKAEAILDYFKMHVRTIQNNAYDWDYHLIRPYIHSQAGVSDEDFVHGHMDVSFFILASHQGLNLSLADMQRLANTLTKNIYLGNGDLSWSLDGSVPISSYGGVGFEAAYDWIDLVEFDPTVLEIAREVYEKHYVRPTWARPFLGWAEILRWSALKLDTQKPNPPQNLRIIGTSNQ